MPKFFDDIHSFYGTGEQNEDGLSLDEFLDVYDPDKYKTPSVTADIIVIRGVEGKLQLLMVKRRNHPCIGEWALPGGFANMDENLDKTARRELEEETGLSDVAVEQMHTWGDVDRDPRGRTISVSYLAYVDENRVICAGDDAKDAGWADISCNCIHSKVQDGNKIEEYELILSNIEKEINGRAIVEVKQRVDSVVKQTKYNIIQAKGIAFDHPKMIVHAMQYLDFK
ncbi:ADP-ribose pyrophosphatase [Lachnospiraceae bacterium KM106-2]|nr:ADP-ribose pyrophosphatase [Lachnospiraceae bacterium KM106-2]